MATPNETVTEHIDPQNKPAWKTIVKSIAFVSVIVLLEVAAASVLVPTEKETKEIAKKLAAVDSADSDLVEDTALGDSSEETQVQAEGMLEVFLGSYHVSSYNPNTGSNLNVDFELYGTVIADEEDEFVQLYQTNQKRIEEQVLIIVRSADISDLTDATLGLIKRKILEKTNLALAKPLIRNIVFSKFSFVER